MDMFRLAGADTERLVALPESGMGYQIVYAWNEVCVAFNAVVGVLLAEMLESGFGADDYRYLSGDPDGEHMGELSERDSESRIEVIHSDFLPELRSNSVAVSASTNAIRPLTAPYSLNAPVSYYRFSAYYKDRRVTHQGFGPETYATTYNDLHFVPSGFAAVGRFALPNPASAQYVFQITTYDKPDLMGTATPNYGQAGGGVEVYFEDGARNAPGASFRIDAG